MRIEIKDATQDAEIISKIYASSWKVAYQGIVPQRYLDELQNNFWVSAFQNWINNNLLKVKQIYEHGIPSKSIPLMHLSKIKLLITKSLLVS